MANRKPLVVIDGVLNEIPSSDSLVSTGGINNTPVGNVAPSTVAATTVNASGQITSTVSTGTAPLVVASTTKVTNLNVDLLDGKDSTDFIDTSATAQTKAGDLTISGNLTVHGTTTTITSNTSGNAATVTNGVYTTGSYNDPAWLTGVNYSKLVGTVPTWNQNTTGTAANVTGVVAIANGGTGGTTVSQAQTNLQVDPAGTAIQMAIALG